VVPVFQVLEGTGQVSVAGISGSGTKMDWQFMFKPRTYSMEIDSFGCK
jgi:hypothetical protein